MLSPPGLSTFCPSPVLSVTSTALTLCYPRGVWIQPRLHYVRYTKQPHTPAGLSSAFELSYLLPLFSHSASFLLRWCSASQMDMQLWVRADAVLNIKSTAQTDVSSLTESVYLVTAISGAAGCICSPHLVPRSRLIVLTTAAWWWESGNYILQCAIPTHAPQSLSPRKPRLCPKIASLLAFSLLFHIC